MLLSTCVHKRKEKHEIMKFLKRTMIVRENNNPLQSYLIRQAFSHYFASCDLLTQTLFAFLFASLSVAPLSEGLPLCNFSVFEFVSYYATASVQIVVVFPTTSRLFLSTVYLKIVYFSVSVSVFRSISLILCKTQTHNHSFSLS
jgi:hypothetical protein